MLEFAEVDSSNNLVTPVPRYFQAAPKDKENPKLTHGLKFRPVVFNQTDYDPATQKLSGVFDYRVDGAVVIKTPRVLDLTQSEINEEKRRTALAHMRQSIPDLEPTIAAIARVASELLRVCGNLDGPGMQPNISHGDLEKMQAFIAATAHLEF